MQYINCKKYAQEILDAVKEVPNKKKLVIFTAGNNSASESYVKGKIKDCEYCNIPYEHIKVYDEHMLEINIRQKSVDPMVGGIIIQLPLPEGWDEEYFTNLVPAFLDVDGFVGDSYFKPCTPEGIIYVLKKELGDLTGREAVVVGRGKLVGKPIVQMLLDENCTVTMTHSKTKNLFSHCSRANIIVCAVGKPCTIDLEMCWNADVVIDVGVNRDENGKLCGDCYGFDDDPDTMFPKVTPVPGGIGLMTRAMLMAHVVRLDLNGVKEK